MKEIRRQIAAANDIDLVVAECHYKGDCPGTCPKCEAEVRELEQALERRRMAGKAVSLLGISAGLLATPAASTAEEAAAVAERMRAAGVPHETLVWTGAKPRTRIEEKAREKRVVYILPLHIVHPMGHRLHSHGTCNDAVNTYQPL